jgi:hypothetical protein
MSHENCDERLDVKKNDRPRSVGETETPIEEEKLPSEEQAEPESVPAVSTGKYHWLVNQPSVQPKEK